MTYDDILKHCERMLIDLRSGEQKIENTYIRKAYTERKMIAELIRKTQELSWHDLRENPNDIPKDDSKFLLCYIGINGEDMYMTWWRKGEDIFPLYIEPIAWCYINKFEVDQK